MKAQRGQLIVALDVETFEKARQLIDELSPVVDIFKIGSQLFTACGPAVVRHVIARGKNVFLDLKFHDIPNTVANAVSAAANLSVLPHDAVDKNQKKIANTGSVVLCTVHTVGGKAMLEAAAKATAQMAQILKLPKTKIVGITVLTSDEKKSNLNEIVLERAQLAKEAGLDGVVASCHEAQMIRQKFGKDFVIITPGIRPAGADAGDQQRIATPAEAIKNGSDYLVVGRPIVAAPSPLAAAKKILEEISSTYA